MSEMLIVAKKPGRKGPKPRPQGRRTATVTFKCYQSYKDWLDAFADHERTTPSNLLDLGLVELAKARNYRLPPKR